MATAAIPARREIPTAETWNTESIFATPADWEAAFDAARAALAALEHFEGKLHESPQTLLEWLRAYETVINQVERVILYARLNAAVDVSDEEAKARSDRVSSLQAEAMAAVAFAEPEIIGLGFDLLSEWRQAETGLETYTHYFERLEQRAPHVRSAEVEKLLGEVSDPFRTAASTHGILANADLTFEPARTSTGEPVELAHSNMLKLMNSRDRTLRRTAWENYADAHLALRHSQANMLAAGVKQDVFIARARHYTCALEAALQPNFIPVEVFYNLQEVFKANLPTWHRYWELRRRALGLEEIHIYDTRAALTENPPEIPFRQAVDWVAEGMRPLGAGYAETLRSGVLKERWVDYRPNKGKRFGAFSSGVKGTHPFVMMSYNDDIMGLSTLAHELGHSMHSYYSRGSQPQIYSYYGLFLAEVASNFNQAMVRAYLLDTQDDRDLQISIIEEAMANFYRYFFIMPTLARFELEIHERVERGQGLPAGELIELMADLFAEGYGPGVRVDRERIGSTWMQFSTHLYANFYVFQYATGISGAHALAQRVLNGGEEARQAYLGFLHAGGSQFPLDTLRQAGVDLASPEPVEATFEVLANYVDRLEALLLA